MVILPEQCFEFVIIKYAQVASIPDAFWLAFVFLQYFCLHGEEYQLNSNIMQFACPNYTEFYLGACFSQNQVAIKMSNPSLAKLKMSFVLVIRLGTLITLAIFDFKLNSNKVGNTFFPNKQVLDELEVSLRHRE